MKNKFLEAVLGPGAAAIAAAVTAAPQLESALMPRVVLSYVGLAATYGHSGEVPGCPGVEFTFRKSESGYDGQLVTAVRTYEFEGQSLWHVAASLAVGLGVEGSGQQLPAKDLSRLGQTIDLLVKSHFVGLTKTDLPGKTALPTKAGEPIDAAPPTRAQVAIPKQSHPPKPKVIKIIGKLPKLPKLRLFAKSLEAKCAECGGSQLRDGKLTGCVCWREPLANVQLSKNDDVYELTFGDQWDTEDIQDFLEAVGGN